MVESIGLLSSFGSQITSMLMWTPTTVPCVSVLVAGVLQLSLSEGPSSLIFTRRLAQVLVGQP